MTFQERLESLGFTSYKDYLTSKHWQDFKLSYLESNRSKKCHVCKCKKIQLHHITYVNLGEETLDDVVPLCEEHHTLVHDILREKNWWVEDTQRAIELIKNPSPAEPEYTKSPLFPKKTKWEKIEEKVKRREEHIKKKKEEAKIRLPSQPKKTNIRSHTPGTRPKLQRTFKQYLEERKTKKSPPE